MLLTIYTYTKYSYTKQLLDGFEYDIHWLLMPRSELSAW